MTPSPRARPDADEFFIGYAPPMPPRAARMVRRAVAILGAGGLAAAAVLALGHTPLPGGTFEFGRSRTLTGTIVEHPYPALRPDAQALRPPAALVLLVAPGKHGAAAVVRGLDGARVSLDATRIARGAHEMLEVVPSSLRRLAPSGATPDAAQGRLQVGESITLRGEIVDSKCFLGVMVPGEGKTHRTCAALCLRGGIPPALHVRDRQGRSVLLLLVDADGRALAPLVHDRIGELVTVSGVIASYEGWVRLATDPATWR